MEDESVAVTESLQRKKRPQTADAAAAMDYSPTKVDNKANVIGGEAETERIRGTASREHASRPSERSCMKKI